MKQMWFIDEWVWDADKHEPNVMRVGIYKKESDARKILEELPINDIVVQYDLFEGFINKYGVINYGEDSKIALKDCTGICEKGEF